MCDLEARYHRIASDRERVESHLANSSGRLTRGIAVIGASCFVILSVLAFGSSRAASFLPSHHWELTSIGSLSESTSGSQKGAILELDEDAKMDEVKPAETEKDAKMEAEKDAKMEAEGAAEEIAEVAVDDTAKNKALAQEEKQAGNAAYKQKEFDTAVKHYTKAIELDGTDISFLTNLAAVHFERKEWDECITRCAEAVEKGRELRADYKLIAKAMTRQGNALVQKGDLKEAIDLFKKALLEHRNADTLACLDKTELALKMKLEDDYINMTLSGEAKDKGNAFFKVDKYPEAVKEYTEAIKRGPPKVNEECYKLYCNRAACYTKLVAMNEAVKDADTCIELKPDFPKGYSRKGTAQFFMREYTKALETYKKGLAMAPDNEELKAGLQKCATKINMGNAGMLSDEEQKERHAKAMADPEIHQILNDPVMQQVLSDSQTDSAAASRHMKDPIIAAKIQKLVAAGIVKVGSAPGPGGML